MIETTILKLSTNLNLNTNIITLVELSTKTTNFGIFFPTTQIHQIKETTRVVFNINKYKYTNFLSKYHVDKSFTKNLVISA